VTFEQSGEGAPTTITYDISGNDPNAEVCYPPPSSRRRQLTRTLENSEMTDILNREEFISTNLVTTPTAAPVPGHIVRPYLIPAPVSALPSLPLSFSLSQNTDTNTTS
jgi:hypothetical protein